jgi:hypothetical protein
MRHVLLPCLPSREPCENFARNVGHANCEHYERDNEKIQLAARQVKKIGKSAARGCENRDTDEEKGTFRSCHFPIPFFY